ncbi:MAG: fibronectin type III domain-containing protein [Candidatus Poribacteria bacterium]|nr:fibronectin type III domain-containing protein [Candidatus Poribacteria bacterium]
MKRFIPFLILLSLLITEAVAQELAPPKLTATPGDKKITLNWTVPSNTATRTLNNFSYEINNVGTDTHDITITSVTRTGLTNGQTYRVRVKASSQQNGYDPESFSELLNVTPKIPAPTNFSATAGDGQVTLRWAQPSGLSAPITGYQYSRDGGAWTSIGNATNPTGPVTGLENGRSYSFRVRATRSGEDADNASQTSGTVTVTPLGAAPGAPGTLNVQRVEDTAILTWSPPSDAENPIRYEYSDDEGSTWKSTESPDTTYTVTGLKAGETYTFLVRGVYVDGTTSRIISHRSRSSNAAVLSIPKPKRVQECPVGWARSDGFAGRNRRVLLYEVKLDMDMSNPVSIYKPVWVAIYVHPDEKLENLEGWKLQVALPYNRHSEYLLTAENSVIVDAGFVEGGFAFIENPEATPFPMTGMGFPGSPAPGFDYRLYDDSGRRVDFGISCYKRFDIFQVLKDLEDPRVLRNVSLKDVDWNASWFIRSEWTVPVPVNVPGAPSLQGVNLVGKWADLKKK